MLDNPQAKPPVRPVDKKEPVVLHSLTLGYEYVFTKYRYHRKGHGDERDER